MGPLNRDAPEGLPRGEKSVALGWHNLRIERAQEGHDFIFSRRFGL